MFHSKDHVRELRHGEALLKVKTENGQEVGADGSDKRLTGSGF